MNTKTLVAVLIVLIVLGGGVAAANWYGPGSVFSMQQSSVATTTPNIEVASADTSVLNYGKVTLRLGQVANFKNISILPVSIQEDSRCPSDVQCIQAGTVRVNVQIVSGTSTNASILKFNQAFTAGGETITLTDVTPAKISTVTTTSGDYLLTFDVMPRT